MKIFDTQSQKPVEFIPLDNNEVKLYVCGPTVYDQPHLGHARCYITWDIVYRYLKFKGYKVKYVRNVTDVDDKIINKSIELGVSPKEIAEKYYIEFQNIMEELNVLNPDFEPKATENINEMIDIVKILCDKGFAYSSDGDVYFRVSKFNKYGRLSHQNIDDLKVGARIESSEKKEDPLDFALWKKVKNENEPGWQSPWGKGRPGWHIECSAMSKKYLGETLDIHAGGQDLIFPHHENEKAQSEAAFNKDFVKYWMHNGFVKINEEKMSKSLGNYITIKDVLEKYDANTIRFFILTNHYRMPVEFNDEALRSAKSGFRRLKNAYEDVKSALSEEKINASAKLLSNIFHEMVTTGNLPFHKIDKEDKLDEEIPPEFASMAIAGLKSFINAMDDDFNTPRALAVLFDIANSAQKARMSEKSEASVFYAAVLVYISEILGFDIKKSQTICDELPAKLMEIIISVRNLAREQKNWAMADKIRNDLTSAGITLKDHKDKPTTWSLLE